ncbi:ROK family protein [Amycolatopsis sp. CA-230715]|uniref:ROK family protein n=1 Tax=Amycolatopsis sp. CA-230715 TaxID=2745196 RepID=UPI001C0269CE|nr:ROK family protein [Amycolatopsis sp. CA-230715]QWF78417.1 Fructokinase [Amycolatopsis sp. CA-230715]
MSWLGVDIGGTKAQAVVVDDELRVRTARRVSSGASDGADRMIETALGLIGELLAEFPDVLGVGVGAAGVIDPVSGVVTAASGTFPQWQGKSPAKLLENALGRPVLVENDVNAFLRGEASAGAALGAEHVIGITVGTGIGGALLSSGELLHGAHGGAGEIGHTPGFGDDPCTCGARGHLESVAAGPSIARRFAARDGRALGPAEIAELARHGDPAARGVYADAGAALGQAIATAATLLDCQTVVVGGGVAAAWDLIEAPCRAVVDSSVLASNRGLSIETARLGVLAVAIGAAALARSA